MYPGMFAAIKEKGLLPNVPWEIVIDSSVVGMKKPERPIYDLAREKAGVKNEEIFFVDNVPNNITAAKNLGWHTFLYDPVHAEESSQRLLQQFQAEYLL